MMHPFKYCLSYTLELLLKIEHNISQVLLKMMIRWVEACQAVRKNFAF